MSQPEELVLRRSYPAARERVFRAWTDQKELEKWYTPGDGSWSVRVTEFALRVGGQYRVEFGPPGQTPYVETSVYEKINPPSQLVFRTRLTSGDELLAETHCTVDFIERGDSTDLVMTETGFPSEVRNDRMRGWGETLHHLFAALD